MTRYPDTVRSSICRGAILVEWVKKDAGEMPWAFVYYKSKLIAELSVDDWFSLKKIVLASDELEPYS